MSSSTQGRWLCSSPCSLSASTSHSSRSWSRGRPCFGSRSVSTVDRYSQSQSASFLSIPKHRVRVASWSDISTVDCRGQAGQTHMRQDGYAVPGQMHVRLDRVRANLDGALEGAHRVLRPRRLVASMGDGLRQEARGISLGRTGGCPRGFCIPGLADQGCRHIYIPCFYAHPLEYPMKCRPFAAAYPSRPPS